jgi:protein-tyrosine phosphatase
MHGSRLPEWDGSFNAFDLGGIPLHAGGATSFGRAYRMGRPEPLTAAGWAAVRKAGVTTIVDLRNADERVRHEWDPRVDRASLTGIEVIHAPTEDPSDAEFMRVCGPWLDHPLSYADNLAFFPDRFAAVFRALAEAAGPVAFHCAGGRDRTGMITAMLLSLADATIDGIAEDYAGAYRRASRHSARMQREHPERPNERVFTDEQIEARIDERIPVLVEWVSTFDVGAYLATVGLTVAQIARLRTLLTREREAWSGPGRSGSGRSGLTAEMRENLA